MTYPCPVCERELMIGRLVCADCWRDYKLYEDIKRVADQFPNPNNYQEEFLKQLPNIVRKKKLAAI